MFESEEQEEVECLVLPPVEEGGQLGLLLNYTKKDTQSQYLSHRIQTRNGNEYDVRLMVKINVTDNLIDPLDFRYHDGEHIVKLLILFSLYTVVSVDQSDLIYLMFH